MLTTKFIKENLAQLPQFLVDLDRPEELQMSIMAIGDDLDDFCMFLDNPNPHYPEGARDYDGITITPLDMKNVLRQLRSVETTVVPNILGIKWAGEYLHLIEGSTYYYSAIEKATSILNDPKANDDDRDKAWDVVDDLKIRYIENPLLTGRKIKRKYIIDKMFPLNTVGELVGQSQLGKSFMLLDMAFCVAHGLKFRGLKTRKGNVVYVAGEAIIETSIRLKALEKHYGVKHKTNKLMIIGEGEVQVDSEASMQSFGRKLEDFGHTLWVIIDTLVKASNAFDIHNSPWKPVETNLLNYVFYNCDVLTWVTHPTKGNAKKYAGDEVRISNADYFYGVEGNPKSSNGKTLRIVSEKNKGGKAFTSDKWSYLPNKKGTTLVPSKNKTEAKTASNDAPIPEVKKTEIKIVEGAKLSEFDAKVIALLEDDVAFDDAVDTVAGELELVANSKKTYKYKLKKKLI